MSEPARMEQIEIDDVKGLKDRLTSNRLRAEDIQALLAVLNTFVTLQDLVRKKKLSILKFLRRIFGFKTEKDRASTNHNKTKKPSCKSGPAPHGRNGRDDYPGADKIKVPHPHLTNNCPCPECEIGRLRTAEPAVAYDWQASAPIILKIFLLERFICHNCKSTFTAPSPVADTAKTVDDSEDDEKVSRCNQNAMANSVIAALRFWYGVPHYRLAKIQGSMGMALPVATQYRMLLQVFESAFPIYLQLIEEAAQGALLHADDTSIKILDWLAGHGPPNKSNGAPKKSAQTTALISRSVEGQDIVLYLTGADQAGAKMSSLLQKRSTELGAPIYMCDGLAANQPGSKYVYIQTFCLDHARRQFYDLMTIYPGKCSFVIDQLKLIYKADAEAKVRLMTPNQRLQHHKEYSRPVMDALGEWFIEQIRSEAVEENDDLGKAINYCLKRWSELNEFHHTAGVPLSNADCEQAIKSIIRHRKNSLFYKTEKGAVVGDVIQSLIATCEQVAANPFKYLEWIQVNRAKVKQDPSRYTPRAYSKISR